MGDFYLEKYTEDDNYDKDWRSRFHYQWPAMSTLMHQSEITINQNSEYLDKSGTKIPDWDGTDQGPLPSDIDSKPVERYSSDNGSTSSTPTIMLQDRSCEKNCRNVLCVVLIFSVVMAAVAGISLSIILTQQPKSLAQRHSHQGHIGANLTFTQQSSLTRIFCKLLKMMLVKTDFPVDIGLQSCHATLLLVEGSHDLHIEMHASPHDGYTLKEKFLRALHEQQSRRKGDRKSDEVKAEESLRVTSTTTTTTTTTIPQSVATTVLETSSEKLADDIKTTAQIGFLDDTYEVNITENIDNVNEKSTSASSTTPVTKMATTSYKLTTMPPIYVDAADAIDSTDTATTEPITEQIMVNGDVTTLSSASGNENKKVIENMVRVKNIPKAVPIATRLFEPGATGNGKPLEKSTPREISNVEQKASPKIVESLMAGGVMKLPLKTNSNFRFLFSSDSRPSQTEEEATATVEENNNLRTQSIIPNNSGWRGFANKVTQKPQAPEVFLTLRRPLASTKSFSQRAVTLTKYPRKRIDITEFADPRVLFT